MEKREGRRGGRRGKRRRGWRRRKGGGGEGSRRPLLDSEGNLRVKKDLVETVLRIKKAPFWSSYTPVGVRRSLHPSVPKGGGGVGVGRWGGEAKTTKIFDSLPPWGRLANRGPLLACPPTPNYQHKPVFHMISGHNGIRARQEGVGGGDGEGRRQGRVGEKRSAPESDKYV